ncbi:MAG: hypothetical protein AB7O24_31890 [Kofleriaceae bacterium]
MSLSRGLACVLVIIGGCSAPTSSGPPAPVPPRGPAPSEPTPPAPPAAASPDVTGYWTGDWGRLLLRSEGDSVRGVYDHDKGTVTGKMSGDTFVGWWCEVPSRSPEKDAGDVEMKFMAAADGVRTIDGKWRYGASGDFRDDWDLRWDTGVPAPELTKRFDDPSAFCPKP